MPARGSSVKLHARLGLQRFHRDVTSTFDYAADSMLAGSQLPDTRSVLANLRFRSICKVEVATGRLLQGARDMLQQAGLSLEESHGSLPEEFLLADLQRARATFDEISGRRTPDDVLVHIFERFCIGK